METRTAKQMVVTYLDNNIGYFKIGSHRSWIINPTMKTLTIGRGLDRTIIPLDNVRYIEFDTVEEEENSLD
jgi:hypothetical protein